MNLPPLPQKRLLHAQPPDHYWYGHVYGYTEEQMRAYARKVAAKREAEVRYLKKREDILVTAMSEIKATNEGKSDHPISKIVAGCIFELSNISE